MYDFCFRLKDALVGILFHNLDHPYIPLHFEEMIFPLVKGGVSFILYVGSVVVACWSKSFVHISSRKHPDSPILILKWGLGWGLKNKLQKVRHNYFFSCRTSWRWVFRWMWRGFLFHPHTASGIGCSESSRWHFLSYRRQWRGLWRTDPLMCYVFWDPHVDRSGI